jgi:glutaredoxin
MKNKLKKITKQENLKVLALNGTPELLEKFKSVLQDKSVELEEYLEMKMATEQLSEELKERKLLESSFKSWSSKGSMQGSQGIPNLVDLQQMQMQQHSEVESELLLLNERVNKIANHLAARGPVNPGPRKDTIILSCEYFHCFTTSWQRIFNDRGHIGWCKFCKKSKKK